MTFLCFELPSFTNKYGFIFVIILLGVIGIPHGATDHLVFKYLPGHKIFFNQGLIFYLIYIFIAAFYLLLWSLFPWYSLIIFIGISGYHLGQSNLYYLSLPKSKIFEVFIYCCWGLFVILAPIVANSQEVDQILKAIIGKSWVISWEVQKYLLATVIIVNYIIMSALFLSNNATKNELLRESLNLCVLGLLFYKAPLMISFSVYFGLWHAVSSILDQINFIKKYNSNFKLIDLYISSLPLTIAFLGVFSIAYLLLADFQHQFNCFNLNSLIGWFFVAIAAITLPHTILRDKLYIKK